MSKLAVIDLGTNVIKVVVGTITLQDFILLYEEKVMVTLRQQQPLCFNIISREDQKNIVDALVIIKKKLELEHVTAIVAKATSLLREARNAEEVITAIWRATGIKVGIISGAEEANLIYLGISSFFKLSHENGLIIDIGGGSVECIIFNQDQQLWEKSFALGIRRVAAQFPYSDPITSDQVEALENYYRITLAPLFAAGKRYLPRKLIGSSGAFRTFLMLYKCHDLFLSDTVLDDGIKNITQTQFFKIYHSILTTPSYVWQKKVNIEPLFLKLIPLSAILVNLIIRTCSLQEIEVTDNSLTTGLFVQEWYRLKSRKLM